jgi:1,4-alpha-glucan branching enzyme
MKTNTQTDATQWKKREMVRLEFNHETARRVYVAGTFNEWNPERTPMRSIVIGQWIADLQLPPGTYEYQYVVDGNWLNDPHAVKSAPSPCGGRNSILVVEKASGGKLPESSPQQASSNTED